jgi:hypothetical protein
LALSIRASSCDRASLAVFRSHVSGNIVRQKSSCALNLNKRPPMIWIGWSHWFPVPRGHIEEGARVEQVEHIDIPANPLCAPSGTAG